MQSKTSGSKIPTLFFSCGFSHNDIYLYKEHGEIPYYLSKIYGCHAIIDDYYDVNNPNRKFFRSVELQSYKRHNWFTKVKKILKVFYLAHKIDILCLFHIEPNTLFKMIAYRLGGGRGKIYLKLDLSVTGYMKDGKDLLVWNNMPSYLKIAHFVFKRFPAVYSVETMAAYNRLKETYYGDLINCGKLSLLPNGFDPLVLTDSGIERKSVSKKEKIIITVGRLGTYQKNTELLLKVLGALDLKDWKVYLIGSVEKDFQGTIDQFYHEHPEKASSVVFTGIISQKEVYEYYNRSRVFLLTSRWEGYAFALVEAAFMRNYIISTDVGGAEDILKSTHGILINQESQCLVDEIQAVLRNIIDMPEVMLNQLIPDSDMKNISWEYILTNNDVIRKLIS